VDQKINPLMLANYYVVARHGTVALHKCIIVIFGVWNLALSHYCYILELFWWKKHHANSFMVRTILHVSFYLRRKKISFYYRFQTDRLSSYKNQRIRVFVCS